jgi:phospholipase C
VDERDPFRREVSRRSLLKGIGIAGAGLVVADLAGCSSSGKSSAPNSSTTNAPVTTSTIPGPPRKPGTRPNPTLAAGTDTLPKITNIVVVMMENHSFDDHFGMLNRPDVDGFKLDAQGKPIDANPYNGKLLKAYKWPGTCQLDHVPGQNWIASHTSYDNGKNDGFVKASGPAAMGYWDGSQMPFYYALANTFPVCDRYFCSVMAQTYPNRRFLLAGTASGITTTNIKNVSTNAPANGTILDQFHAHNITWMDYYTDLPASLVLASVTSKYQQTNSAKIDQFYTDAAAGKLPQVSYVSPNFDTQSEEDPQDVSEGENFSSKVINAVMSGPQWPGTVLIWTFDEHGGYYDHVPPPAAIKPDGIPPGADQPGITGAYDRLGFRVPTVVVSPFAKKNYVSHVTYDHTSVLKLMETKWNLPALTYRDANANDLLDPLDLNAPPAFAEPPKLPAPGTLNTCQQGHPSGPVPPANAIVDASQASSLRIGATA